MKSKKMILQIKNSFSQLIDFPESTIAEVKQVLTYEDKELAHELKSLHIQLKNPKSHRHKYFIKNRIKEIGNPSKCLLAKNNTFPSGLLPQVFDILKQTKSKFTLEDKRQKYSDQIRFKKKKDWPEARPWQDAALSVSESQNRGVFEASVGSGKTLLMASIILQKRVPTLVVVPSLGLIDQTLSEFGELFGKSKVGKLGSKAPIIICNIQSLQSEKKKDIIDKTINNSHMLLIDEFHRAGAESYTSLLPKIEHIFYRYGFTGTFLRNDSKTLEMHGVLSNILYKYPPKQAIADGYLTPPEYNIVKIIGDYKNNYQSEYKANYCDGLALRHKIVQLTKLHEDKQVLILVDRKATSGSIIHTALKDAGLDNVYVSGDTKRDGRKKAREDFNAKKFNILVASSVFGEGIDIRSTDVLILANGGKSPIKFVQNIGRAVRLYKGKEIAKIYDFRFKGTKYLEKHLKVRKETFQLNFGGEINE